MGSISTCFRQVCFCLIANCCRLSHAQAYSEISIQPEVSLSFIHTLVSVPLLLVSGAELPFENILAAVVLQVMLPAKVVGWLKLLQRIQA